MVSKESNVMVPDVFSRNLRVIVIGDNAVGKTSICKKFVNSKVRDSYLPTIGAEFHTKESSNGSFNWNIWDLSGSSGFVNVRSVLYSGIDAAIICFDITNRESLESIDDWIDELQQNDAIDNIPLIFVANKMDTYDPSIHMTPTASYQIIKIFLHYHGLDNPNHLIETSSKTGRNISKIFEMISNETILISNFSVKNFDNNNSSGYQVQ